MDQKSALLAGAKRCLVEKGYARTTARDIAEASGAHLGSIGYHYGGKDRLMNMAALELSDEWGDTINRTLAQAQGQTERERVLAALAGVVDYLHASREVQSASLQAFAQAQFDDQLREQIVGALPAAAGPSQRCWPVRTSRPMSSWRRLRPPWGR